MKTVTVRIPVFVCADGSGWMSASAESALREETLVRQLDFELQNSDFCTRTGFVHWQEFEVPIPEPVEVEGKVV